MRIAPRLIDTLSEITNIGVGRAADVLNKMIKSRVKLTVPSVEILNGAKIPKGRFGEVREGLSAIQIGFSGGLDGEAALVFYPDSASKLVSLMWSNEQESPDVDGRVETLSEIGNIVINGVLGSFANICHLHLDYAVPRFREGESEDILEKRESAEGTSGKMAVLANAKFGIDEHKIEGYILLIFWIDKIDAFLAALEKKSSLSG